MSQNKHVVQWSRQDRLLHLLPAIPLVAFYVGTTYLLAIGSVYLAGMFLLLWVGVNFSMAGICAGCPYRGGYCPGVCQLYFAPFLATVMYKDRGAGARSFKVNLALLGAFGIGGYVFGLYWLFLLHWHDHPVVVLILVALLIMHMPLSFFILCPKCSYNDTCPMANVHKVFNKGGDLGGGGKGASD
jgi:hypothetical protein